jgi:predicted SAM-dependent methyltransferase
MNRHELSKKYGPKGFGLEIAGLHNPWPVLDPFTKVLQLDLFDHATLRKQYPEMSHKPFVDVHVLDDGNYLKTIADESMDFLFSSHVLEHLQNPIEGIKNWLRVLKKGRHAYLAVPLRDQTFDRNRVNTSLDHVIEEYKNPYQLHLGEHYREYFRDVDRLRGVELDDRVYQSLMDKPHIHFHCWDFIALEEFFFESQIILNGFNILEFMPAGHEALIVLQKFA